MNVTITELANLVFMFDKLNMVDEIKKTKKIINDILDNTVASIEKPKDDTETKETV
jgi:hypothetical protein